MEEGNLIAQLFLTLSESYDPLVTALENLDEKQITLDLCKQRLLAEEAKRNKQAHLKFIPISTLKRTSRFQ